MKNGKQAGDRTCEAHRPVSGSRLVLFKRALHSTMLLPPPGAPRLGPPSMSCSGGCALILNCAACSHGGSGRAWTVSIAVPGSIIDNTQNLEFATFVAGQIARTAAIFNVDEVQSRHNTLPPYSCGVTLASGEQP